MKEKVLLIFFCVMLHYLYQLSLTWKKDCKVLAVLLLKLLLIF